ncbi:ATP-binding protein [Paraburkholderia sp. 2C]
MIRIGSIEVDLERRQLLRDGAPLQVGSRAFDILAVLIEARGNLVLKNDLLRQVWPLTFVEENNLHVQMSRLRYLLGDSRALLQTVAGRGYRLSGTEVQQIEAGGSPDRPTGSAASSQRNVPNNLPERASDIIGRDDATLDIINALETNRHVTLTGAGGIGKTTLAIEVAYKALASFTDGVYWISLASATDYHSVLDAASKAIGINPADGPLSFARIGKELRGVRMLFVIDNCEQVAPVAAELAESLTTVFSDARVIATSRESIKAAGEHVYRVGPLHVSEQPDLTGDVLPGGAVQLFLARAQALDALFPVDRRSTELIRTICRRLDGIPLAIELAAARATVLGVEVLANRLDDRFRVLTGGSRSVLPRHQTLRATFDWSYALLDDVERTTFRRLSIFSAGFSMPAAIAVAIDDSLDEYDIVRAVSGLVEKSLIVRPTGEHDLAYRLLETTRSYAQEKLEHNGERRKARLGHANYLITLLDTEWARSQDYGTATWQRNMRHLLDDLRTASAWALSPAGDKSVGESLAVRLVWLLFELSLVNECCVWARRSLVAMQSWYDPGIGTSRFKRVRLQVQAALAAALVYVNGPQKETFSTWSEVLTSAIALGDKALEARAIWGMWNASLGSGDIHGSASFAERFSKLESQFAGTDLAPERAASGRMLGDRIIGTSAHYAGDQNHAFAALQRFLSRARGVRSWMPLGRSVDQDIVSSATFSRVVWMKGERELALRIAGQCVTAARSQEQAIVTCHVLIEAGIPIALLSKDHARAAEAVEMLYETSSRNGLNIARACSRAFEAYLLSLDDVSAEHQREFLAALKDLDSLGFGALNPMLYAQYAMSLLHADRRHDAITVIEDVAKRCEETGNAWYLAEVYRIHGELLIAKPPVGERASRPAETSVAKEYFNKAFSTAQTQGAGSLQVRAALSLARLRHSLGHGTEAVQIFDKVCSAIPEARRWQECRQMERLLQASRHALTRA